MVKSIRESEINNNDEYEVDLYSGGLIVNWTDVNFAYVKTRLRIIREKIVFKIESATVCSCNFLHLC